MGEFVGFEQIAVKGALYINPIHVSAVKEVFRTEDSSGSRIYIGETYYFEVIEPPSTVIRKLRASIGQFI